MPLRKHSSQRPRARGVLGAFRLKGGYVMVAMLDVWRARRGRKVAVAAIAPLVESSRRKLNGLAQSDYLEPYIVGFLSMLITLVARRTMAAATDDAVGLVQAEAWGEITGLGSDSIGEEICLLSSSGDVDFYSGCSAAAQFFEMSCRPSADGDQKPTGGADDVPDGDDPAIVSMLKGELSKVLWAQCFEDHIRSRL